MKKLKENSDFSTIKSPSPFKIERAPGFIRNDSAKLNQAYLNRRQEEEINFHDKLPLIANLDRLETQFLSLFQDITVIRNSLLEELNSPLLSKKHRFIMTKIIKELDAINSNINNNMILELDKLGAE